MTQVTNIPTNQIVPGNNDRKIFNQTELEELAASIEANGLIQPITVRPVGGQNGLFGSSEGVFEIVAGERRFRAISEILQLATAPCIVKELSDEQASAVMMVENIDRTDLNPIEESDAYRSRQVAYGWSIKKLSDLTGKSKSRIKRRLSLQNLNQEIRHLVGNGHLPIGHAEIITDLDPNRQRIAVRIYSEATNGLPLASFRQIISQLLEEQSQNALFDLEDFFLQQVHAENSIVFRGKGAKTNLPTRNDLPKINSLGKSYDIAEKFINDLMAEGLESEARAVGTLLESLIRSNHMKVA